MVERRPAMMAAISVALITALIVLAPKLSHARGDDLDASAARFVEALGRDMIGAMGGADMSKQQRDSRMRELLHRGLDLASIGRHVLGRHWDAASRTQLAEYSDLFAEYLLVTYSRKLRKYEIKGFEVTAVDRGDGRDLVVTTRVELLFGVPVEWNWRLRQDGEGYRVVDMAAAGVSLAALYRSEFGSVVKSRGLDALIDALRKRTGRPSAISEITPAAGPSIAERRSGFGNAITN